jgi:hypothetical protein
LIGLSSAAASALLATIEASRAAACTSVPIFGPTKKYLDQLAISKATDTGNAAESVLPPKKPPAPSAKQRLRRAKVRKLK